MYFALSPASLAVSILRCVVPGPFAVWHDAQFSCKIGSTSALNAPLGAAGCLAAVVVTASVVGVAPNVVGDAAVVEAGAEASGALVVRCVVDEHAARTTTSETTMREVERLIAVNPMWHRRTR
jgi:hypothetical protein